MSESESTSAELPQPTPAAPVPDAVPSAPEPAPAEPAPTPAAPSTPPAPTADMPLAPAAEPAPMQTPEPPPTVSEEELTREMPPNFAEEIVEAVTEEKKVSNTAPVSTNQTTTTQSPAHNSSSSVEKFNTSTEKRTAALRARQSKRDAKLARIMEYARNRGSVRNDEIKRILRVSDATASRYATMLVLRGELFRTGKGRGARYAPRS